MRKLSFKGFLRTYLSELTGSDTQSLSKLAMLTTTAFPRASEALFLYVIMSDKAELLSHALHDTWQEDKFVKLKNAFSTPEKLLKALAEQDMSLSVRYHKIYQSYLNRLNRSETDRNASLLMHEKTLKYMQQKKLSKYRVYTDLGLNPGNINAYLKRTDASKVSRSTARMILEYVRDAV